MKKSLQDYQNGSFEEKKASGHQSLAAYISKLATAKQAKKKNRTGRTLRHKSSSCSRTGFLLKAMLSANRKASTPNRKRIWS
ncbi:hypothetical protein QS257_19470 [Terrilactibacillus sp. S3-3]|nr:hypothetical protein QS257_19470 [Terrilactibacillus sp. S3-3]